MEDGLWQYEDAEFSYRIVLILVVMEDGLWLVCDTEMVATDEVLILVVMEDGLWLQKSLKRAENMS